MSIERERGASKGVKPAQTDGPGGDSTEYNTHTGHLQLRGNTSSTLSLTASSQGCKGRLNINEQLGYLAELEKPGEESKAPESSRTELNTGT